jgi:hypothetical protein
VTTGPPAGDADARLSVMLLVLGLGSVPLTIVAVGLTPQGARAWIFLTGLALTATMSIWAGVAGRRALGEGTSHTATAVAASVVGLVVGGTAALMRVLALVGSLR